MSILLVKIWGDIMGYIYIILRCEVLSQSWHLVRYIPHRPDVIKPALHCCMIYSKPLSPVSSMSSPWRWCFIVTGTRPTFDSFDAWSVWKRRWRCHRDGGRALAINRAILHQQAFVSYQIISNHIKSYQIISNQSNHIKSYQIISNHIKSYQIISNHIKSIKSIKSYQINQIISNQSNQSNHIKSYQIISNHMKSYQINQINQIISNQSNHIKTYQINQIISNQSNHIKSIKSIKSYQIISNHIKSYQIISNQSNQSNHIKSIKSYQIISIASDRELRFIHLGRAGTSFWSFAANSQGIAKIRKVGMVKPTHLGFFRSQ